MRPQRQDGAPSGPTQPKTSQPWREMPTGSKALTVALWVLAAVAGFCALGLLVYLAGLVWKAAIGVWS